MSQVTTAYSFDAPTDYINFTSLNDEEDNENVDSWFEEKANLENQFLGKNGAGLFQGRTPLRKAIRQQAIVTPLRPVDNTYYKEAEKENHLEQSTPLNACSSLEVGRTTSQSTRACPQRRSPRLSAQKDAEQKHRVKLNAKRCATSVVTNEIPPSKKMKVSSNTKKPVDDRRAHQGTPERAKSRHTVPCTPPVRQKVLKSTEEQELEKRMKMQQEVVEMRKKNEEFKKFALAGAGQPVKKSASQVTKSVDFHFCTDERIKPHKSQEYKEVNFTSELRKHPPSPARVAKGCTVIKPFNLSQGKKRTFEETTSTYVPLAQQIEAFHKRTPNRYHLRSKKDEMNLLPSKSSAVKICRDPQTPVLQTKQRTRPVTYKSAADQEAELLEKMQQYKFKAQELDPRILEDGPILPKKPPVKPPTQPIGFDLEIEKRIQEREPKKKSEEEHFEFHSRPCPTKILEDVVGVPEKKILPITIPKSPAFSLKNRVRALTKEEEEEEEEAVVIKAQPVPHYGVPFKPQIPEARTVEVCPFSFDSRDKERQLQKERKIKELQKGEMPKFKALPLPHFDSVNLPEKKVKTATQMEPFCLETDRRGALKMQTWKHQLEEELKQQKEAACFKARPNTTISQEPFIPKKEKKSAAEGLAGSLVQEPFQLATEKRAQERQELERKMAELEAQKAQRLEELRQQEEQQQQEELAQLRKELVHKANPIRKYQAVEVKSSDQPLTVPVSPKFSTRFHC
ncbi:targeting protein for Xklp2 isoform X1 [Echinops telfairi]|uniref:Targeting protein for Xklp2 isoform X1 n=1 Tax=Echinops telfairi TaxID=9371 RepID=A0AC55DHJ8_ECHTE|nr:targeting protein for Xklp2 isoform X1 [Echinops telfairi]